MTDQEINAIASAVLRDKASAADFIDSETESSTDFDGGQIVRVLARYKHRPAGETYSGLQAMHDIRSELLSKGDDRFVFLENKYEDEVDPVVEDAD